MTWGDEVDRKIGSDKWELSFALRERARFLVVVVYDKLELKAETYALRMTLWEGSI